MKRRIYLSMKSLAEARELWLSRFDLEAMAGAEVVPVTGARGRVTAAPVMARRSSPAVHQAAMDGFAIAAALTFGATPDRPRQLALGREAFPINTGHVMPPGTDAVIMVEQVPDPEADPITVEAPTFPWQHVRRVGEDLVAGEMVLPGGSGDYSLGPGGPPGRGGHPGQGAPPAPGGHHPHRHRAGPGDRSGPGLARRPAA